MCRKARTRWVGVAEKIENAYIPHTPYIRATAFYFPCITLNSNSHPILSPRGRELERGQQAARLVFGRLGCWERLLQFGECPLPNPPPRGRERVAADSGVAGRLKKKARNINSGNFSDSLYRKADGANAASVFSDGL